MVTAGATPSGTPGIITGGTVRGTAFIQVHSGQVTTWATWPDITDSGGHITDTATGADIPIISTTALTVPPLTIMVRAVPLAAR